MPKDRRGAAFALSQFIHFLSYPVVAFLAYLFVPTTTFGYDGWRTVTVIGALGAIIVWFLRLGLPESPRWLMLHGRFDDTRKAFGRLGMDVTDDEVRGAAAELAGAEQERRRGTAWTAGVRRALILVCLFFVFQQEDKLSSPILAATL